MPFACVGCKIMMTTAAETNEMPITIRVYSDYV
jgi:hypothetical protein